MLSGILFSVCIDGQDHSSNSNCIEETPLHNTSSNRTLNCCYTSTEKGSLLLP